MKYRPTKLYEKIINKSSFCTSTRLNKILQLHKLDVFKDVEDSLQNKTIQSDSISICMG